MIHSIAKLSIATGEPDLGPLREQYPDLYYLFDYIDYLHERELDTSVADGLEAELEVMANRRDDALHCIERTIDYLINGGSADDAAATAKEAKVWLS